MIELQGTVCISKRLRQNAVWQRPDYGWAWVDLLMLANDRPRTVFCNGVKLEVKRGQLAWSLRSLAQEWRKGREWMDAFIRFCQDSDMIRVECKSKYTLITVLNYDAYNPINFESNPATEQATDPHADPATEQASEQHTKQATDPQQNREGGMEKEKGEAPRADLFEIPDDSEVEEFCAGFQDLARGVSGIPEVWWRGWVADTLRRAQFPRDWKRSLKNAFLGDFVARHPKALGLVKNGATVAGVDGHHPGAWKDGDMDFWWTDSLADVRAALHGATAGQNKKTADRLREIITIRERK